MEQKRVGPSVLLATICVLVGATLLTASGLATFMIAPQSYTEFLQSQSLQTFHFVARDQVSSFNAAFETAALSLSGIFTAMSLDPLLGKSNTERAAKIIERISIFYRNHHVRVSMYTGGLIVHQQDDPERFLVVNASIGTGQIFTVQSGSYAVSFVENTTVEGSLRHYKLIRNAPGSTCVEHIATVEGQLKLAIRITISDVFNVVRAVMLISATPSYISSLLSTVDILSDHASALIVSCSGGVLAARAHGETVDTLTDDVAGAECFNTTRGRRCLHTKITLPSSHSHFRFVSELHSKINRTGQDVIQVIKEGRAAVPYSRMCQTFQLVGADHENIYVAACHANSVDFYIATPRKAFQPELSHLLLEKAAFIAMISIFFGMLMGAVQFAGLFAVRQIVANMVDACAHALDGVIKGRAEAAAGRNIRGSFLAWFTDTRPIVEAQAAVHALVQDLMTALPSREAPSALRLVQGLPQGSAEANPFAAATGGPAAQTGVASTLMFHLGSVSLLHRDDKTAYCEIMNAATLIVDTAGGALERVAAGYLLATFNCHLPCAEHAQVAVEAALKIHAMMQAHHCSQSPADSGSESFFHALGHKYSLIVDSGPFTLHSFEEIGETRNTTMRCSVLESASEALLLDLAPLMSMLRVRVSATEVAAAAIHLPTCVVDCVEVTDRAGTMRELQLFEVITDSSSMEPDQQQRIAGLFARMRAGDYDGALRLSCGETRQLHRHEDRLRLICKDKINSFITRRTPLLPYARSEWGIWLPLTADELERKKR